MTCCCSINPSLFDSISHVCRRTKCAHNSSSRRENNDASPIFFHTSRARVPMCELSGLHVHDESTMAPGWDRGHVRVWQVVAHPQAQLVHVNNPADVAATLSTLLALYGLAPLSVRNCHASWLLAREHGCDRMLRVPVRGAESVCMMDLEKIVHRHSSKKQSESCYGLVAFTPFVLRTRHWICSSFVGCSCMNPPQYGTNYRAQRLCLSTLHDKLRC
jgi:hypothetical protein